jgi:hypothetical protein
MSYATLLDALFALDLTDSELRDSTSRRPRRRRETLEEENMPGVHPETAGRKSQLLEEPSKLRRAAQPKAAMRRAAGSTR